MGSCNSRFYEFAEIDLTELEIILNEAKERARANGLSEKNTTVKWFPPSNGYKAAINIRNYDNPLKRLILRRSNVNNREDQQQIGITEEW